MLSLNGPNVIYPGRQAYFTLNGGIDNPPSDANAIILESASGAESIIRLMGPNGTDAYTTDDGKQWYTFVQAPLWLQVLTPVRVEKQKTTLTLAFASTNLNTYPNGEAARQTILFDLEVDYTIKAPREIIPHNIPLWEDLMKELADKYAPDVMNGIVPPNSGYDIGRVYYQVGDYLRTDEYLGVALEAAKLYKNYLDKECQPPGAAVAYSVFPKTLTLAWEHTGDTGFKDTLLSLTNSPYVACAGEPSPNYGGNTTFRETALALQALMEFTKVGQPVDYRLERCACNLIGQINQTFVQQDHSAPCQPFWFGLAAESLIEYFQLTDDDRVIGAFKTACDFIWKYGVDPFDGMTLYDIWIPNGDAYYGLNLMFVNAWWFLYKILGDRSYRDQGDILFEHFNDDPDGITFSSKQFAQNYRSSIDSLINYRL